ncbi:MAG TPA: TM2 domain-containing protein [Mycobacteriales bacterium]|jgi:TM2 domain-containing membrane protein YozV|nr:TM2 domain-containing protein [Mycobacteriales bacterium]
MTDQSPYDPSQQPPAGAPVPPPPPYGAPPPPYGAPPPGYGGYAAPPPGAYGGPAAYPPDQGAPYGRDQWGRPLSDKSKLVAGLLQIFLGSFGVGRFYTGHTGMALAMLFTCGGLGVWALVDGILLLVKNDWTDARGLYLRP